MNGREPDVQHPLNSPCNRPLSAMMEWPQIFSKSLVCFFTQPLPDSYLPSHSWLWFISLPFLPHPTLPGPPSNFLGILLLFTQTLDPDFHPGHVPCHSTCLVSNMKLMLAQNVSIWVIHCHTNHSIKRPMPIWERFEEVISLGIEDKIKGLGGLINGVFLLFLR